MTSKKKVLVKTTGTMLMDTSLGDTTEVPVLHGATKRGGPNRDLEWGLEFKVFRKWSRAIERCFA